mmetsp:Transcript_17565/g.49617  ORF Transcript_17565/g.49617 Transcript_17565/m.49617 type:complete len:354 (-) Transcript_17565:493-1554(-)
MVGWAAGMGQARQGSDRRAGHPAVAGERHPTDRRTDFVLGVVAVAAAAAARAVALAGKDLDRTDLAGLASVAPLGLAVGRRTEPCCHLAAVHRTDWRRIHHRPVVAVAVRALPVAEQEEHPDWLDQIHLVAVGAVVAAAAVAAVPELRKWKTGRHLALAAREMVPDSVVVPASFLEHRLAAGRMGLACHQGLVRRGAVLVPRILRTDRPMVPVGTGLAAQLEALRKACWVPVLAFRRMPGRACQANRNLRRSVAVVAAWAVLVVAFPCPCPCPYPCLAVAAAVVGTEPFLPCLDLGAFLPCHGLDPFHWNRRIRRSRLLPDPHRTFAAAAAAAACPWARRIRFACPSVAVEHS